LTAIYLNANFLFHFHIHKVVVWTVDTLFRRGGKHYTCAVTNPRWL